MEYFTLIDLEFLNLKRKKAEGQTVLCYDKMSGSVGEEKAESIIYLDFS